MFGSGRKKQTNQVSAIEFGAMLGQGDSKPKSPSSEVKDMVDPYVLEREKLFLSVFAMDYVTFMRFGDTPIKNAILDSYYHAVSQNVRLDDVHTRLKEYAVAIQTPPTNPELDEYWMFGKAFARFCHKENDIMLITMGILFLRTAINHTAELYQRFEVIV